jgi:hypothetical protein
MLSLAILKRSDYFGRATRPCAVRKRLKKAKPHEKTSAAPILNDRII